MPRFARWFLPLLLALAGAGCATRNTVSDGPDAALMLRGYDPVAYFTMGRAVKGRPELRAGHDGVSYRFANEAHHAAFLANPARYVPAYGGACSNGANYALKTPIGAVEHFRIHDGRLFMFGSADAAKHWDMDPATNIRLGDHYWQTEMKDVPSKLQNLKRWIFRVPHYKSDAQLEAEWQAWQARRTRPAGG